MLYNEKRRLEKSLSGLKYEEKRTTLTFSFDDGIALDIRLVEIFNQYGLKGAFNPIVYFIAKGFEEKVEQFLSMHNGKPQTVVCLGARSG